jgi:hypothetical protein
MSESAPTLIGRNADGEKLYVTARLEYCSNHLWRETVDHTRTTERLRLSIQGTVISKYGNYENDRSWVRGGQVMDELLKLVTLSDGWTVADAVHLSEVWRDYHLNDMKAGCAHQPLDGLVWRDGRYGREIDLKLTPTCPETGYAYGSKWLYQPLPYEEGFSFIVDKFDIEPPAPGSRA